MVEASCCNFFNFLFSWWGLVRACRNFELAIKLSENWTLKVEALLYILFRVLRIFSFLLRFRSLKWLLLCYWLRISVFLRWDPHIQMFWVLYRVAFWIGWLSWLLLFRRLFFFSIRNSQISLKVLNCWLVAYNCWLGSLWMDLSCYDERLKTFNIFLKFEIFTFITSVRKTSSVSCIESSSS